MAMLLVAQAAPASDEKMYDAEITQEVRASNECLSAEIDRRIDQRQNEIGDEDRSKIRMAVANACFEHDTRLAQLTNEYRSGSRSLADVTQKMLIQSLALADAMIAVRLKQNAKRTSQDKSTKQ